MADVLKDNAVAGHAVAAAGAAAIASSAVHPLDTLKTLLQVGAGPKKQFSLSHIVERLRMVSGVSGLYSGLGWSIFGKFAGFGARFGVYEIVTAFYKDGREDSYVHESEALLAGMTAGFLEAVVCTPFELFKVRSQVSAVSKFKTPSSMKAMQEASPLVSKLLPGYNTNLATWNSTIGLLSHLSGSQSNMVSALKQYPWMLTGSGRAPLASEVRGPAQVASFEGWSALWKGLRPAIARDCIFGGVFFCTWQFGHVTMLTWKSLDMVPPPRSIDEVVPVSSLATSLVAGFSGIVAGAASHSFDTAKSRSQAVVLPKYMAMERKLLKWKAPGLWQRVTGMSPADGNVMLRGFWLRTLGSGATSFLLVGSYLLAVDYIFD